MPEESHYILPKSKPSPAPKVFGAFVGLVGALIVGFYAWDAWVFNHMTAAQHLWEAKRALETPDTSDLALRHVEAIPANSPEAGEARVLGEPVRAQQAARKATQTEKDAEAKASREARATVIAQLSSDLKNLGYDLSVGTNSQVPEEIVITSSEFNDTDHRVRFLSFIRGENTPFTGVCWNGFNKVRLRSSIVPVLGFNESYSLNCF